MENTREMTFGEKVVGVDFNPAGDQKVARLKEIFAEAIDIVGEAIPEEETLLTRALYNTAISQILLAQMSAVKSVTNRK